MDGSRASLPDIHRGSLSIKKDRLKKEMCFLVGVIMSPAGWENGEDSEVFACGLVIVFHPRIVMEETISAAEIRFIIAFFRSWYENSLLYYAVRL